MAHEHETHICHEAGTILCPEGTEATTYVVWRWIEQGGYNAQKLCDVCADDIRHSHEHTNDVVLVWMASLSDAGLAVSA